MKPSISRYPISNAVARWIAVTVVALGLQMPVFAALGDASPSIEADRAQLKASLKIIESDAYAVHEMRSPTGTVVREYVSRTDGRVFGVAWQGPFIPDLRQLLGSYFHRYSQAAKVHRESQPARRPLNIREPRFVVQTAGHMGAFAGRAYDPGLLPAGVGANDIR